MLNFKRHYLANRAPFNLRFHASWFQDPMHLYAFNVSTSCKIKIRYSRIVHSVGTMAFDHVHVYSSHSYVRLEISRRSASVGRCILRDGSSARGMDAPANVLERDQKVCSVAVQNSAVGTVRSGVRAAKQLQTVQQSAPIVSIFTHVLRMPKTISMVEK